MDRTTGISSLMTLFRNRRVSHRSFLLSTVRTLVEDGEEKSAKSASTKAHTRCTLCARLSEESSIESTEAANRTDRPTLLKTTGKLHLIMGRYSRDSVVTSPLLISYHIDYLIKSASVS